MISNSPELRQRIKEQSKAVADYLNKDPLWLQLRNHPKLFCLHPTPEQLAILLDYIAEEVERRGDIDYDRDPGETAEWLRAEASKALTATNPPHSQTND